MKRPSYQGSPYALHPEIIENHKIECPICGHKFRRITHNHAALHSLTINEFRARFGGTTFLERCRNQILCLYDPHPFKLQVQRGSQYLTFEWGQRIPNRDQEVRIKTESMLTQHLKARRTIAVFPKTKDASPYLVFDVDSIERGPELTHAIHDVLREWFRDDEFHTHFSGRKAFNVSMFFSGPVSHTSLQAFAIYVKRRIGLHPDDNKVEIFPGEKAHPVKLPMAYHEATGLLCPWVEHATLHPISNQYEYLLAVTPIDRSLFETIVEETVTRLHSLPELPRIKSTSSISINDCQRIFEEGLTQLGTRHHWTFRLAIWLRDVRKVDEPEAYSQLSDWAMRQIECGMSSSSPDEVMNDTYYTVRSVYHNKKYRMTLAQRDVYLTTSEVEFLRGIRRKTSRSVFLSLLLQFKMYGHINEDGSFTASDRQLERLSGVTRKTIMVKIQEFEDAGWTEVLDRGNYQAHKFTATRYRILVKFAESAVAESLTVTEETSSKAILHQVLGEEPLSSNTSR